MKFLEEFKSEHGEKIKVFLFGNTFLLLLAFMAFIFYRVTNAFNLILCPMKKFFNSICPFCGGTRCVISFFSLDFKSAFMYHPSTMLLMIYALIVDVVYLIDIIFKKEYVKKIFKIEIVLTVYIIASAIQYLIRLYYYNNNLDCPFMFTSI